jgi:hypothetical protein
MASIKKQVFRKFLPVLFPDAILVYVSIFKRDKSGNMPEAGSKTAGER